MQTVPAPLTPPFVYPVNIIDMHFDENFDLVFTFDGPIQADLITDFSGWIFVTFEGDNITPVNFYNSLMNNTVWTLIMSPEINEGGPFSISGTPWIVDLTGFYPLS